MSYIVELEPGVWLTGWGSSDPARTMVWKSAKRYKTIGAARAALTRVRYYRKFPDAQVTPLPWPLRTAAAEPAGERGV